MIDVTITGGFLLGETRQCSMIWVQHDMKDAFTIKPMNVGAEIFGLDLSRPIDESARLALYRAWLDHGLLIFRETNAGAAEHVALSRCFGILEQHPVPELWANGDPYLIELGRRHFGQAYVYNGDELRLGRFGWHRDTAYTPDICKGAILRMERIPPEDGETLFADSALAYDALPSAIKERIEDLEFKATIRTSNLDITSGTVWKTVRAASKEEHDGMDAVNNAGTAARYPSVIHPMVITHPESGRKCIYVSPQQLDHVIGLPQNESDQLLEYIVAHVTDERFRHTHSWRPGDMILWDNRRFLHATLGYHPKYERTGYRTTLAGPLKTGRYFHDEHLALS